MWLFYQSAYCPENSSTIFKMWMEYAHTRAGAHATIQRAGDLTQTVAN